MQTKKVVWGLSLAAIVIALCFVPLTSQAQGTGGPPGGIPPTGGGALPGNPCTGATPFSVLDVQNVINMALARAPALPFADANMDGVINVTDIQLFINSVLGQKIISRLTPDSGPIGTVVAIQGMGFDADPTLNMVTFTDVNGNAVTVAANQVFSLTVVLCGIEVTVPAGLDPGTASVTVAGHLNTLSFEVQ